VVQRAIVRACKRGEADKALAYAKQTHLVWLDGMYACRDAKIRLPAKRKSGSVHVAHGKDRAWLEVAIDGEMFGTGPINAEVSAGSHTVEIWDSRTGTTHAVTVRVPSDGNVHLDDQGRRMRVR
jgi:hypothetical protein